MADFGEIGWTIASMAGVVPATTEAVGARTSGVLPHVAIAVSCIGMGEFNYLSEKGSDPLRRGNRANEIDSLSKGSDPFSDRF
jgi:hypothetical protein